ncbi:hypothetical protein GIB67_035149, partial [Kingdonia uniflora]
MDSSSLGQTCTCIGSFAAGHAAAFQIFQTISRKPEIDVYDLKGRVLDNIRGDIELRNIHFSYPARPDEQIFNDFYFFISSGTTVALVGQSGSGKSTVISLIERFYDPQIGEVLIDGINIKAFQLKWIREKIGLVSQEPVLFASTIKENIAYGKDGATLEEIIAAAELANALKFIDKLPHGLDTSVGEQGVQLSGRQKQRVAIAKAILKDPRILLLDEATSALDAVSEHVVQKALDRIMVNRTTVIVAHRLSTIRNADMIAVIRQGEIVEKGSHSELIKNHPDRAYCELIRLQELYRDGTTKIEDVTVDSGMTSSKRGRLIKRIRSMCFARVVNMEISWFDEPQHSSGEIGARLSSDAADIGGLVGDALSLLVTNLATALAGLVIAFTASWQLSLIILVLLPFFGFEGYFKVKSMVGAGAIAKLMYQEASQIATDAVGNIRTIASFGAEEKVMSLFDNKCKGPLKTGIRQGVITGIGFGLSCFFLFGVYAASFYAGARLVDAGKTTFSDVFQVFYGLTMAAMIISQTNYSIPDTIHAKNSTTSVFGILDQKSKIDLSDDSGMTLENVKGDIQLHSISFKYPIRPDVQNFQNLSLAICSGKTVGLVGESWSGKSTVISLLQRFYDPDSGHITIDGIEIQKFQLRWLRQQMGLVSQEPVLFNDTIRANIAYGKEGPATEVEISAASELANAHMFISGLQHGYDTI